jgi:hypothetical protein
MWLFPAEIARFPFGARIYKVPGLLASKGEQKTNVSEMPTMILKTRKLRWYYTS